MGIFLLARLAGRRERREKKRKKKGVGAEEFLYMRLFPRDATTLFALVLFFGNEKEYILYSNRRSSDDIVCGGRACNLARFERRCYCTCVCVCLERDEETDNVCGREKKK